MIISRLRKWWPQRLGTKLAFLVTLLVSSVMIAWSLHIAMETSDRALAAFREEARIVAENIAVGSTDYLFTHDLAPLENFLLRSARFPDVREIQVSDAQGNVLANVVHHPGTEPRVQFDEKVVANPAYTELLFRDHGMYVDVWQPIKAADLLGWVRIHYSLECIARSRRVIWQDTMIEGVLVVIAVVGLLLIFMHRPMRAIAAYTAFADRLNENFGNLTPVNTSSIELARLGGALNRASTQLAIQDQEIKKALGDLKTQKFALDEHAIVVITDTAGRMTYANDKFCHISGYAREELIGKPYAVHDHASCHADAFYQDIYTTIESGNVWHGHVSHVSKSGGVYWVDTTVVPFADVERKPREYVYISTDITPQKHAEQNLARLAAFPEHNLNMVLSCNRHGEILYLNPTAQRTFTELGLPIEDASAVLPDDIEAILAACIATKSVVQGCDEVSFRGRTFLWVLAPVPEQDIVHAYAAEITKHKQAEEKAHAAVLEKLSAEAANKAKSTFLAYMSHEIRTPLSAIIGFSEALLDSDQTMSDRVDAIRSIARNGKHLLQIINDILDLSKIEAEKLELESLAVNPFDLLVDVNALVGLQAQDKGLHFTIEYEFPMPVRIMIDPVRTKQILVNL